MKPIDLLYFEDVSPFHEAVFTFPIIGKLSMRQMSIVGFSAIISWSIYQGSGNLLSMIPLCAGGYVGLKKFNVRPIELQIISVIKFMLFGKKAKQKRKFTKKTAFKFPRQESKKLGLSEVFQPKLEIIGKEIRVREIFTDPLKPIRLQVKLETADRRPIVNTQTRVEFDGNVISTLATNNNGEIEVLVIPQTLGEKNLLIYAKGFEQPVFEEILSIKSL
ncbi:MAG TPA: hypothetical protein VGA92_06490 [Candidatus Nitrosotenuis sp.]